MFWKSKPETYLKKKVFKELPVLGSLLRNYFRSRGFLFCVISIHSNSLIGYLILFAWYFCGLRTQISRFYFYLHSKYRRSSVYPMRLSWKKLFKERVLCKTLCIIVIAARLAPQHERQFWRVAAFTIQYYFFFLEKQRTTILHWLTLCHQHRNMADFLPITRYCFCMSSNFICLGHCLW